MDLLSQTNSRLVSDVTGAMMSGRRNPKGRLSRQRRTFADRNNAFRASVSKYALETNASSKT